MKFRLIILLVVLAAMPALRAADEYSMRYVGGDVSLLPDYEQAGAKYLDSEGKRISDLLTFCYDEGMNCMRVRLFVNPDDYTGSEKDPNAKQDLEYILPLCKRIKNAGLSLMLDFHYSDTWADPAKQWTPKAWLGLTGTALYEKIYNYTRETLETLKAEGAAPDFIQPGNEISYGMLWGPEGTANPLKVYPTDEKNWTRLINLLDYAIKACREVCPDAGIVIHTERVSQTWYLQAFYKRLEDASLDYDIIGLSYYPYYHGKIGVLDEALTELEQDFPNRQIMIVETGYPYAWEVPGTNQPVDYPYTETGQNRFAQELVDTLLKYKACTGLFWWWLEYNANGAGLSNWYNAPLFDSRTGRVTKAFSTICSFGTGHDAGVDAVFSSPARPDAWYDLQGRPVSGEPSAPGIYVNDGRKVIIRQ